MKDPGSTWGPHGILPFLRGGEVSGTAGVAVKCVDIGRNARGESGSLASF